MNFLTIDLDYFTLTKNYKNAVNLLNKWMKVAPEVYFIDTHEKVIEFNLVPHNTTAVYNVDYHNDITVTHNKDYEDLELDEGTWGNFLPKSVKKFTWLYPNKTKCVIQQNGLCVPASNNPKDYPITYYKRRGYHNLPENINRLVVCLSPNWANPEPIMNEIKGDNWWKIQLRRIK